MTDSDVVVLRMFANVVEAEIAKSGVKASTVDSFIQADDAGGMRPHLAMNSVRLLVRSGDAERAAHILRMN